MKSQKSTQLEQSLQSWVSLENEGRIGDSQSGAHALII